MNLYKKNQIWKISLLVAAIIIGVMSLWYTNRLVKSLEEEENKKVVLWADALRNLQSSMSMSDNFEIEVVRNNTTTPVILTDEKGKIISSRNLDSLKSNDPVFLKNQLAIMKRQHKPIIITIKPNVVSPELGEFKAFKNYIYYKDSLLLTKLRYYPYFQLGVVGLFVFVSYLAFNTSKRAEQNRVWVGMAKETAHQLGTPISSLIAWQEYLKMKGLEEEINREIDKDIKRLQTITERFSKIGSTPELKPANLAYILEYTLSYMRTRVSNRISIDLRYDPNISYILPLNAPLFEWVIENLTKNAIDAMNGIGKLEVDLIDTPKTFIIDVKDTGKGIPKNDFKTIFNPGFTTKSRGWGLGLTLAKRIIEEYHQGHIYVKESESGKGTTFRIMLYKA